MDSYDEEAERPTILVQIENLKNSIGVVKKAERSSLPNDIQEKMQEVDAKVDAFVEKVSVANWTNDGALKMLEQWDQMRGEFRPWSSEKKLQLRDREELIAKKGSLLNEARKNLENLENQENYIRRQINEEHRRRTVLDEQKAAIDAKIEELQELKLQLNTDFGTSSEQSNSLSNQLDEVIENTGAVEKQIEEFEGTLQELSQDDTLNSEQKQHDQFLLWKENVEKVMNEIQKVRELEWKSWEPREIVDWICRLDQGTFRVYRPMLEEEIPSKIDIGEDLLFLVQDRQIIRELGVTKIRHRDQLINHIDRLNRNNPSKNQPSKGETPNV